MGVPPSSRNEIFGRRARLITRIIPMGVVLRFFCRRTVLLIDVPSKAPLRPMSSAHLHLMLNHIPLFGLLFGGGLLFYALARGSDLVTRIAMVFFVIAGLGAGATYLTGEGAEEVVEDLAGVTHSAIEAHEELGFYALLVTAVLGVLSLLFLFWYRSRSIPRAVSVGLLVLTLIGIGVVGYTAYTGGQINHPELRGETASVVVPIPPTTIADAPIQSADRSPRAGDHSAIGS